ncbi:exosome subunit Mtr3 [Schizosaccharomyces osmophilus]|uniref:Exosome subunit Mtr3 n=1 Tax=Schizosaccharomyces osmophilus TaxID=2545709 RepID=A0AAF0AVA7_9SCHI|nr:exosome subunit Mtr3 [Schizosaccharomyces osmophilus]WBW72362.1 exosome subunit Mtr3 [Schizosaccharomyces osmophilus]
MTDRKRVCGPLVSVPPAFEVPEQPAFTRDRNADNCRKIYLKLGWATKAMGSAYYESGKIKIGCNVYGPRPNKTFSFQNVAKLNCEVKYSPFSLPERKGHVQSAEEKDYGFLLETALSPSILLHLYPKSSIDVYVQILESDGTMATLAAAITCASAAIADANIECIDLVTGVSLLYKIQGPEYWVDPDFMDECGRPRPYGSLVVGHMAALGHITQVWEKGNCTSERLKSLLEKCTETAKGIRLVINHTLSQEKLGSLVNDTP